jgi:hypothetical protein
MARKRSKEGTGRRGARGARGARGPRGLQGLQGFAGPAGQVGPAGPAGQDGPATIKLAEILSRVAQELEDVQRTLRVQFTRIAELQSELDSLRVALTAGQRAN